jgi:hypothetical protein
MPQGMVTLFKAQIPVLVYGETIGFDIEAIVKIILQWEEHAIIGLQECK